MAALVESTSVVHRGCTVTTSPARGGATVFRVTLPLQTRSDLPGPQSGRSVPLPVPFTIRTRSAADARGIRLGLNRDLRTGDPALDTSLYIASDAPAEELATLLASPELRRELVHRVHTEGGVLDLSATKDGNAALTLTVPIPADEPFPIARRNALAEALASIASQLPTFHTSKRPSPSAWAEGCLVLGALSPIVAVIGMAAVLTRWPIFASGDYYFAAAVPGIVAAFAAYPVMFFFSRGLAHGWFNFKVFAVLAVLAGPFAGVTACTFVNCAFDDGPTSTHDVEILRTLTQYNSKSGTTRTAILRSWIPGHDTEEMSGSSGIFAASEGNHVVLRTRPGVLGAEWLVGFGREPRGQ